MKILKNIYVSMIVACSALTFWMASTKQTEQSDFLLRNVEAIATSEKPPFEIWAGAFLYEVKPGCSICKPRNPEDRCNIHDQLPDCYGNNN